MGTQTHEYLFTYIGMHTYTVQYMNPHLVPGHSVEVNGVSFLLNEMVERVRKRKKERFQVKTVWRALVESRYLMYLREKKENTAPTLLFFCFSHFFW